MVGGASFSSTMPLEKNSAPISFQFKHAKNIFKKSCVKVVDEFRTRKYCAACRERSVTSILQDVYSERKRMLGKDGYPVPYEN